MTDYISHKTDRWLYPLEPANGETTIFQVRAGTSGAWVDVNLDVGTYYPIGTAWEATGIEVTQRLWTRLADALEGALGSGSITIAPQDAIDRHDLGFDRIKITWDGGAWQAQMSAAAGHLSPQALGFDSATYTADASGTIHAPWTYRGAWHSHTPWGGGAVIKRKAPIADYAYSSARHWEAAAVSWGVQQVRVWRYTHLPAARIFSGRSTDPARAAHASLAPDDPNAQLVHLHRAMLDPQAVIVVMHDVMPEDALEITDDRWERVQLWRPWLDLLERVSDMSMAGDYWTWEIAARVVAGDYAL